MDQVENKVEDKNIQQQTAQPPQQVQAQEQVAQPESDKEINWKKWKEARDKERKEAAEMAKRAAEKEAEASALKAALEAIVNKSSTNSVENGRNQYEEDETEDQKISKRVDAILAQREAESERRRKQKEQEELPQKLSETFGDFNQVCSDENLDYLQYHYPEVASAFRHAPDSFEKWANVYKAVKRFIPNTETKKDLAKSQNNFQKPQSASKSGLSQTGNPAPSTILTEDRKNQNWERMQRTMKGLS